MDEAIFHPPLGYLYITKINELRGKSQKMYNNSIALI